MKIEKKKSIYDILLTFLFNLNIKKKKIQKSATHCNFWACLL